ncbi:MAG: TrkH family potassium uptake protein [Erysipelotrichaceae bacterium]|nr:TrkH family potassium uptake protein [Erysipelotrichaceae bacterium]
MNYKLIFHTIGKILLIEAILLIFPLIVNFIYQEENLFAFALTISILMVVGTLLIMIKPKNKRMFVREGFVIVGLAWIVLSLFGALPFTLSGEIPNYINAVFETVSGFTTTGASILNDVEAMSKSMLFWRSFTHWIGGMGVLVFVLAILPNSEGQNIYLLKAESTGPQVGKLVSKVRFTARILYVIYFVITLLEVILLLVGGNSLYESIVMSFGTAGTGGFGIYADSVGGFNIYSQVVIAIFMMLFGINFNIYYLVIIGKIKQAIKSEELRWYFGIILLSTTMITINLMVNLNQTFGIALKDAYFQVSSIMTTTGFSTVDFNLWPTFSKTILIIIMFVGGCAGSTGGGIKVSRMVILFKSLKREVQKLLHPNSVAPIKMEGEVVEGSVVKGVNIYFAFVMILLFIGTLLVSFDGLDFTSTFTGVIACINNIGPGLNLVGPMGNFDCFSYFSKIILSVLMLIGRLEVYPILILFLPKTWTGK